MQELSKISRWSRSPLRHGKRLSTAILVASQSCEITSLRMSQAQGRRHHGRRGHPMILQKPVLPKRYTPKTPKCARCAAFKCRVARSLQMWQGHSALPLSATVSIPPAQRYHNLILFQQLRRFCRIRVLPLKLGNLSLAAAEKRRNWLYRTSRQALCPSSGGSAQIMAELAPAVFASLLLSAA